MDGAHSSPETCTLTFPFIKVIKKCSLWLMNRECNLSKHRVTRSLPPRRFCHTRFHRTVLARFYSCHMSGGGGPLFTWIRTTAMTARRDVSLYLPRSCWRAVTSHPSRRDAPNTRTRLAKIPGFIRTSRQHRTQEVPNPGLRRCTMVSNTPRLRPRQLRGRTALQKKGVRNFRHALRIIDAINGRRDGMVFVAG